MPQASLLTAGHSLLNPRRGWDPPLPTQPSQWGQSLWLGGGGLPSNKLQGYLNLGSGAF